uniref:Uncharacterized protein n=1 Tax=Spongospora subterranea TaxID=70186 RepID=A0A0H5RNE1_9EUKA|eukprot:CRZ10254.1 hypothetical protein [Spongospora subterranea]
MVHPLPVVMTPSSKTQTRFGSMTRVSPIGEPAAPEGDNGFSIRSRSRTGVVRQRRVSGVPTKSKSYNELKKGEASMIEENSRLLRTVESLKAKIQAMEAEKLEDDREQKAEERMRELEMEKDQLAEWGRSCQERSSEVEFMLEERRISDRENSEKQLAQMRQQVEQAELRLESYRAAIESSGFNAISLAKIEMEKPGEPDELCNLLQTINIDIVAAEAATESLLSEIEIMFEGSSEVISNEPPQTPTQNRSPFRSEDDELFYSPISN